ncbi:MAG: rod shape-determining protein RodA [Candidatus Dadabacteria bacterium]|nr:MAG: rod shape-determining protein RodA [Candidatus Dadabacteria bacterium]
MFLIDRRIFAHFSYSLLFVSLLIPAFGIVVLYSAGYEPGIPELSFQTLLDGASTPPYARQMLYAFLGLVAMGVAMGISGQVLYRIAIPFYVVTLILLGVVLISGEVSHGSQRWLRLPFFRIQPSELAKLGLVFVMARYLAKKGSVDGGYRFKDLLIPALIMAPPLALIAKQPDLGTAISIAAIGVMMVMFMGVRPKTLFSLVFVFVIASFPLWKLLKPYQQQRIISLIKPADPLGSGYHIIQSKIAIGSGQLFGKGYMKGTQSQLEFIPEHTTDFVFSVLAEEWGFVGALTLLGLYLMLLYGIFQIAEKSRDLFLTLVTVGIAAMFLFHIVVNVGMVTGLLPVVGLTLPMFSYGGSSLVVSMFGVGLVLGIGMRRYQFGQ